MGCTRQRPRVTPTAHHSVGRQRRGDGMVCGSFSANSLPKRFFAGGASRNIRTSQGGERRRARVDATIRCALPRRRVCMQKAARPNCHTLRLLYSEPGRAPTAFLPAATRSHCCCENKFAEQINIVVHSFWIQNRSTENDTYRKLVIKYRNWSFVDAQQSIFCRVQKMDICIVQKMDRVRV